MATIDDIISRAQQVRDETTIGANTASRVGGVMKDTADHTKNIEESMSSMLPIELNQDNADIQQSYYIRYDTGAKAAASINGRVVEIKNNGYTHVWVKSDFFNTASAVIAFYSGNAVGVGYMQSESIQSQDVDYGEYEANVPNGCTYIALSFRLENVNRPPMFTLSSDVSFKTLSDDISQKSDVAILTEQKVVGYENLKPYLKWNGTTRIVNNGTISFAEGNYVDIALTSTGNLYQCAVVVYAGATKLYDSSWKKAVHYEAVDPATTHFTVWFRTSDNSTLSADTIDDIGNYVTNFEYTTSDFSKQGNTRSAEYIDDAIVEMHDEINAIQLNNKPKNRVINIAHQGYSTNGHRYGGSRASSVIGAAEHGFDYAEIDIQFSSDGAPFGSHNDYVEIGGENVPFSTLTWAEISVLPYQGEHYSSLDELVSTAKMHNVGLVLDKTPSSTIIWTDANWSAVFGCLDKYRFTNVIWLLGTVASYSKVFAYNKYAHCSYFSNLANPTNYRDVFLQRKDTYPFGTFSFSVNITGATAALLETWNATVPSECPLFIYTVDDLTEWDMVFPYVSGITSNDYSEYIIQNQ